jgi:2-iminobutanoate/2-iminopropanoate deaminase
MKTIISTTEAPAAIGAYSQAVVANGMLFDSSQLSIDPTTGDFAGADFR